MEIKCSVAGKPINIPAIREATLLGAALLGGVGVGAYGSYREAVAAAHRVEQRYLPDKELQSVYQEVYRKYTAIAPLVREVSRIVGDF